MIGTLKNDTLDNPTALTVAKMSFPFHYYLSFYLMLFRLVLSLLGTSVNLLALKNSLGSTLR
jgi:ribose/xylose/arabinose/galactoside ABC-type transport system permease subunit